MSLCSISNKHTQKDHASEDDEVIHRAISILDHRFKDDAEFFNKPCLAKQFFLLQLGRLERECFGVAFLNYQLQLIEFKTLFFGSVSACEVHSSIVAREALLLNASKVMFVHNHPGGSSQFSDMDVEITRQLVKALKLIDVKVIDHFLIAKNSCYSMLEIQGFLS